jgi:DNA-binding response OmpR family regulator
MARILVVEDDPDIAELIVHYLEKAGHSTERLSSGTEVMPRLRSSPVDLLVLDLMLPGMDGMAVCDSLRRDTSTSHLPVIMLTARGEEADRVAGLERGADDYVTKPFSPRELVARVAARLRRPTAGAGQATAAAGVLEYGPILIDDDRHIVTVGPSPCRTAA